MSTISSAEKKAFVTYDIFSKNGDFLIKMWYNVLSFIFGRTELLISKDLSYSHNTKCVVALGCFDGVHLGHLSVINSALERAKSENVPCCIWSFSEPPKRYFNPSSAPLLTDGEEKTRIISELGVDIYLSVEFNRFVADLTPEEFFEEYLLKRLDPVCIVCGYDFTFGKRGTGNTQKLRELCEENGVSFISISPVDVDGTPVSSSTIREYLSRGEIEKANLFLGRRYSVSSDVISGKRLGRKLGFPTVNQQISQDVCIPANGVYLTKIFFDGNEYFGITNVGTQPTVGGTQILFETYILDFWGDLYGKKLRIEFLSFIRPEKKFNSLEELTDQINRDVSLARNILVEHTDL